MWLVVEFEGCAGLLDAPLAQYDDAVRHRHCFDLIVRDVNHGCAEIGVQLRQLHAHLHAQFGVQVRQRLVEKEQLRLPHDRTANGDTLALPAGQRLGFALQVGLDLQHASGAHHAAFDLVLRHPRGFEPERKVLVDCHMRIERVRLKHHRDLALRRRDLVHALAIDAQFATGDLFKARDHAQQRRLATAGGTDEHDELAMPDIEVDAMDDLGGAVAFDEPT